MTYIGIDPGKVSGACAILYEDGEILVLPFEEETFLDAMFDVNPPIKCALEHVGAMPGQGVVSMFNFGQNFGFIQGVLKAYSIPYELVRPQKWKKEFGITKDKNTSIEVCKRLFPNVSLKRTERCRKENSDFAEAILLAEFARRKL